MVADPGRRALQSSIEFNRTRRQYENSVSTQFGTATLRRRRR